MAYYRITETIIHGAYRNVDSINANEVSRESVAELLRLSPYNSQAADNDVKLERLVTALRETGKAELGWARYEAVSETQARLDEAYKDHEDLIRPIFEAMDADEEHEGQDAGEALSELAYGISTEVVVNITLGGGGPNFWIEATCSKERFGLEMKSAEFHATWFGNESRVTRLEEDSAMYRYAAYVVEGMTGDE